MYRDLFKLTLIVINLCLICNVLISHQNEDIRNSILKSFEDKPRKELFKIFHFLFAKKYHLNTEEGIKRYKIFKDNMNVIKKINEKNLSYKLGLNEFSDLTDEEFRSSKLGGVKPQKFSRPYFLSETPEIKINSGEDQNLSQVNIDWTQKMTPAKSQGICGSCWAFATIGALEGNYNINFNKILDFSEQQLVDCETQSLGCQGGYPDDAFEYIKNQGIAYDSTYEYTSGKTAERGVCKQSQVTPNYVVPSYRVCPYLRCSKTQYINMLSKGPTVIYMDGDGKSESNNVFRHYSGGVIEESMTCTQVNHAVVAVGISRDENGEFLISRNSWGESWGEKGNFRIRIRSVDRTCFMQDYAILPEVKETLNPVPDPILPGCLKLYSQCNLQGDQTEICSNKSGILASSEGFDIGKFKKVIIFFTNQYCRGSYYTLNNSFACFSSNGLPSLINSVQSIIVEEQSPPTGCVWLYDDNCLSGNKVEVCSDVEDLSVESYLFANKISSFKLGPGVESITIYLDKYYTGYYATVTTDQYGLNSTWMDKEIESIKITKTNP
jgi:hypothetical protein